MDVFKSTEIGDYDDIQPISVYYAYILGDIVYMYIYVDVIAPASIQTRPLTGRRISILKIRPSHYDRKT